MLSLTTTVHIYCPRLGEAPRIEEETSRARRTTLGNGSSSALPARAAPGKCSGGEIEWAGHASLALSVLAPSSLSPSEVSKLKISE